jgi:hypothetical protein
VSAAAAAAADLLNTDGMTRLPDQVVCCQYVVSSLKGQAQWPILTDTSCCCSATSVARNLGLQTPPSTSTRHTSYLTPFGSFCKDAASGAPLVQPKASNCLERVPRISAIMSSSHHILTYATRKWCSAAQHTLLLNSCYGEFEWCCHCYYCNSTTHQRIRLMMALNNRNNTIVRKLGGRLVEYVASRVMSCW